MEFEASYEEAITELELAGLGKSKLDLKLDYLSKVGFTLAADILKDSRMWENDDGSKSVRKVESWEECHKVLLELEAVKAGGRALQWAYGISGSVKPTNKRIKELENQLAQYQGWDTNGGGARAKAKAKAKSGGKGDAARPKPCWDEAKGKGTCSRGDSCWFSHDPQVLKEFNKGKGKGNESKAQENEMA